MLTNLNSNAIYKIYHYLGYNARYRTIQRLIKNNVNIKKSYGPLQLFKIIQHHFILFDNFISSLKRFLLHYCLTLTAVKMILYSKNTTMNSLIMTYVFVFTYFVTNKW